MNPVSLLPHLVYPFVRHFAQNLSGMDGLANNWATNVTAFQFTGARKIFPPAGHAFDKVQTASRHLVASSWHFTLFQE